MDDVMSDAKAAQIAALLPPHEGTPWALDGADGRVHPAIRCGEMKIGLRIDRGRIRVIPYAPLLNGNDVGGHFPAVITLDPKKSAEVIAGDIGRYFLGKYIDAFADAARDRDRDRSANLMRVKVANTIRAELGPDDPPFADADGASNLHTSRFIGPRVYVSAETSHTTDADGVPLTKLVIDRIPAKLAVSLIKRVRKEVEKNQHKGS